MNNEPKRTESIIPTSWQDVAMTAIFLAFVGWLLYLAAGK